MIYLRTGANGSGKTLLTLRDVREKSVKENRPVYHNGRFELLADFGWTEIKTEDWQSVPDGAIFIIDECHNDFPVRSSSKDVPEYVRMLAEHRRRGFDFYLITQHPNNLDAFVRRLIGSPGWHQHLKRASGAALVSVIEWPSVNQTCEKPGAGATGSVRMVPYPKEVYGWYKSASLNTVKTKIPFQVKVLVASILLVPVLGWYSYSTFMAGRAVAAAGGAPAAAPGFTAAASAPGGVPAPLPTGPGGRRNEALTPAEYLTSFTPRIAGLNYTAARYDELTRPVVAPVPAACVATKSRCDCYTQQGTPLQVPAQLCSHIVRGGFFNDFDPPGGGGRGSVNGGLAGRPGGSVQAGAAVPPVAAGSVPAPVAAPSSLVADAHLVERVARADQAVIDGDVMSYIKGMRR
jgi:zona occludens toxin